MQPDTKSVPQTPGQVNQLSHTRERFAVELRRNTRNNEIESRRKHNFNLDNKVIAITRDNLESGDLKDKIKQFLAHSYEGCTISSLVDKFKSGNIQEVHQGLIGIRKCLSANTSEVYLQQRIQQVIDGNIVVRVIELMKQNQYPRLQMEAAWTITNLVAGNTHQCQSVINKGALPVIISLLNSENQDLVELLVWGIGNISSDTVHCRDVLLKSNVISELIRVINVQTKYLTIKQCGWSLSNLCRGSPAPDAMYLEQCAATVYRFLTQELVHDLNVINDICWAIVNLTDKKYNLLHYLHQSKALPKLFSLFQQISQSASTFQIPLLYIFGNIASGTDFDVDQLLKLPIIPLLQEYLTSSLENVRSQAVRVFQYLASGNPNQVHKILQSGILLPTIVPFLAQNNNIRVQTLSTLSNLMLSDHPDPPKMYLQLGVYQIIVGLLSSSSTKVVIEALECVHSMLLKNRDMENQGQNGWIRRELERHGLIDKVQGLQMSQKIDVYNTNQQILREFYQAE